uniref:Small ribosomal subunit protein uS2c n=1 Tax=Palmophyllum crassum TaxID=1615899 RepID=A0A1L7NY35_9VIRI|nr:ribosomal protein S2 [Palmophyllum crassum]BAW34812.1 ribosomal protein S2 [Palmophyllum crassum]
MYELEKKDLTIPLNFLESIYLKQLMTAGIHYGHQVQSWNPKMSEFIYTQKNGIHILDLLKTLSCLQNACQYLFKLSQEKKNFLFIGTKYQASKLIETQAQICGAHFVNSRWLGGMLTNWSTIKTRIETLNKLENKYQQNKFGDLPKKEASFLIRQLITLQKNLGGVKSMTQLPDCVICIDPNREAIAISECKKLKIPVVGLIDTNCNPELIDFPIPANDDAVRSINYILTKLTDSILAARAYSMFQKI